MTIKAHAISGSSRRLDILRATGGYIIAMRDDADTMMGKSFDALLMPCSAYPRYRATAELHDITTYIRDIARSYTLSHFSTLVIGSIISAFRLRDTGAT